MDNVKKSLTIRAALLVSIVEAVAPAALEAGHKRPILESIHLESDGEKLTAIATDSARLHRVIFAFGSLPVKEGEDRDAKADAGFYCNINAAGLIQSVRTMKTAFKKMLISPFVTITATEGAESVTIESPLGSSIIPSVLNDYPVPGAGASFFENDLGAFISFNPEYITDAGKAAKAFKNAGGDMVTMHAPNGPLKPFFLEIPTGSDYLKADVLITPMRGKDNNDYPGYYALKNGGTSSEDFKKLQDDKARMDLMQKTLHELTEKEGVEFRRLNELESENQKLKDQLTSYKNNTNKETSAPDPLQKRLATALDRLQVLESKAATIEAENRQLKADNSALKEAASKQPEKEAEQQKKTDGGQKPATEKQLAYIRKLGGETPDGLTIRAASIIITQLKRGDKNSINRA